MTRRSSLGGGSALTSLPCGFAGPIASTLSAIGPKITTASGSVTATTFKNILSVTGSGGQLDMLALTSANATSKTMSLRVTVDGVVVFNGPTSTVAAAHSFVLLGALINGTPTHLLPDPVTWRSTLLIEYTSSVTETDGANVIYAYKLRA